MQSNLIPEGFKEDVSSQVAAEHRFKNIIIDCFQSNGFELVKTPLIEHLNSNSDDNVFKIEVNKKEKKLNIRDDITLQIARLSQTRLSKKKKPLKLCYYGEVIRKKGTMLRPERQFLQIGAETIGENNFLADVEMIELAYTSLNLVGIKNITIEISSRIFYDQFLNQIKSSKKKKEIQRLIKLKDLKSLLNIVDKKHYYYLQNLFSCTGIYRDKKNNLKNLNINKSISSEILNIENIVKNFSFKKNINFFLDLCEIDHKNYHSGVRFTFFAENIRGEIARGGRYFIGGLSDQNTATGFTCYMDSILRATSVKLPNKRIIVPFYLSNIKIKDLIKKGYSLVRNTADIEITKKLAKDQNCQFYFVNNSVNTV